jgi:DNA-binding NarL/FixJ family response regulator
VREGPQDRACNYELTVREREIVDLLRHGLNTVEMVAELGISDSTVRTHVQSILNKLRVHSRIAAVALLDERAADIVRAVS